MSFLDDIAKAHTKKKLRHTKTRVTSSAGKVSTEELQANGTYVTKSESASSPKASGSSYFSDLARKKIEEERTRVLHQRWAAIKKRPDHVVHPLTFHPPPERFQPDDPRLVQYLKKHGYAVVASVASPAEIKTADTLLWQHLHPCGMRRERFLTFENYSRMGSSATGIMSSHGVGQSPMVWHSRELPRVKQAFANIWGTDDLIVSFDGANIFRPWHRSKNAEILEKTRGGWFHVDQGPQSRGFQCVQGLVSYRDATPQTGGLCVIPGSHLHHDTFLDYAANGDRDFVTVPNGDVVLDMPKRLVTCKAGDLLLWDSRCIHCNTPAIQRPTSPPQKLLRHVHYICMTPRNKVSAADIKNGFFVWRLNAHLLGITTSHWPHRFHPNIQCEMTTMSTLTALEREAWSKLSTARKKLIGWWPHEEKVLGADVSESDEDVLKAEKNND